MAAGRNVVWLEKLDVLKRFVAEHNRLPALSESIEGVKIGRWCGTQRQAYHGHGTFAVLTEEQKAALEDVPGWWWEVDLKAVWFQKLGLLKTFVEAHSRIPTRHDTCEGVNIGLWCINQRQSYKSVNGRKALERDQIAALESVPGWWWDCNDVWVQKFEALKSFAATNKRLPTREETFDDGTNIKSWCNSQRRAYKSLEAPLEDYKKEALESVPGWWWGVDHDAHWGQNFDALKAFVAANNRIPTQNESFGGFKLGKWCNCQRQSYKGAKTPLTEEKKAALESVPGWWWGVDRDAAWRQKFDALKAFVTAHSRLPSWNEEADGIKIGRWCGSQRSAYKGSGKSLTEEQKAALESVPGWWWEEDRDAIWHQNLDALKSFVATNNRMPNRLDTINGIKIGRWCGTQRQAYRGRTSCAPLTEERKAALESVPGWWWDDTPEIRNSVWFRKFDALKTFVAEHNRLPHQGESFRGIMLGQWCDTQRQVYKGTTPGRSPLSEDKKAALESVPGWRWAVDRGIAWRQKLDTLKLFVAEHGRLPTASESFGGVNIGQWCRSQRSAYKSKGSSLTDEQKAALESVPGWWWDGTASWRQKLETLKEFVAEHSRLPTARESFGGINLGTWCVGQRQAYRGKRVPLTEEQKEALNEVPGWWWTK